MEYDITLDHSILQLIVLLIMKKHYLNLNNGVVVPRSSNKERIVENFAVFDFELDYNDMKELSSIIENLRLEWNPTGES